MHVHIHMRKFNPAKGKTYTVYNERGIHEAYYTIIKAIDLYTNVSIVSYDHVIRLVHWLK